MIGLGNAIPKIWSIIISEQAEKLRTKIVKDVTRSVHVTKSKGRLSDFTSTQNLVEILDEWLQLKFGNKHLLIWLFSSLVYVYVFC